jgi:RHS repeat-associated protein
MTSDGLKDITISDYDRRNLPLRMTKFGSNYDYNYDDGGNRINKKAGTTNEYYLRDHTGRELLVYDNNTGRLKMANIFGNGLIGRVDVQWDSTYVQDEIGTWYWQYNRTDNRFYYLKDHLGSIRVTLDENADVAGAQDYYPFGEVIQGRSFVTGGLNEKYKFTEKERDTETNYDYFGARFYDSELGRWLGVDPLADKYPGWSPYNYTFNNPLNVIDPDGMDTTASVSYDSETNSEIIKEVQNSEINFDDDTGRRIFEMTYITAVIGDDGNVDITKTTKRQVGSNPSSEKLEKVDMNSLSKQTQDFINKSINYLKNTGSSYLQMRLQKNYERDKSKNDLVLNLLSGGSILGRYSGVSKVLRAFWGAATFSYKYFSNEMIKENNRSLKIK